MSLRTVEDAIDLSGPAEPIIGTGLPDDILRQASGRVQLVAFVGIAVGVSALTVYNVILPSLPPERVGPLSWGPFANAVVAATLVASAALAAAARAWRAQPQRVLDLALGYEVAVALAIGLINQWYTYQPVAGLSWVCLPILASPIFALNTPGKVLAAALAAASMDLVGVGLAVAKGRPMPDPIHLYRMLWPNYVCAAIAVVPAGVVTTLSRQLRRARELGNYRLVERIGRGGMGEVWRATHRMLARPAAVKLIAPSALAAPGADPALIAERFTREAEATSRLRSPHTIQLYDFGVSRDGRLYLVMEFLDGLDLDTLVSRFGPLPAARVVHVLDQTAASLEEAHDRGLIHRDVKPANIYLCRLGLECDFVKVLDFGLVKLAGDVRGSEPVHPGPELTPGTPSYMAPELAAGEAVDRRSDVYSLACVAYWLLTGQPVFEADSYVEMMARQIDAAPVPPSRRTTAAIPPALEQLVLDGLAKSPERRPSSMGEFRRRLAAIPVDPWTEGQARAWWEEHLPDTGVSATAGGAPAGTPTTRLAGAAR